MKKKFTFLMAALMLLAMMVLPGKAVGQTKGYEELFTIASADVVTNSSYAAYNTTVGSRDYVITFGGNNKSVGTNSNNRSKCNLSSYSKYAVSPVTTTSVASAYACKTSISDVSKISYTFNGGSNQTNTNVYVLYSSDNTTFSQITLTSGTQGAAISSGTAYEFAGCSGYFALLFVATNSSGNWRIDDVNITFNKTTYTVTYNANGADNGTAPSAATYDAGANVTVASNSGSLEKTGYNFTGWNTDPAGEGTHYDAGTGTISAISADVTLYAEWTSSSTPSIVANGGTNSLGIACTATTTGTMAVAFNNMDGFTSEAISLYNDSGCTEAFSGGWLYDLSITGDPKNTINYKASENAGTARTVYMRVSASYNLTTYYSNVVAITQAAPTFTVTYNANGGTGTMTDSDSPYFYGSTVTTLTNAFTAPNGKVFDGWNTANDGSGTGYAAGATFTITANTTLYAQWASIPTYTLVSSTSDIIPGAHYVIVGRTNNGTWAMGAQTGSNTYRNADEITGGVVNNQVSQENLMEFVISGPVTSGNKSLYTIYDESQATNHFLNANGGTSSNSINVTSTIGNTSQWTIAFGDGDEAVVTANFSGRNLLSFNSSANPKRFTGYANKQTAIYLFKKDIDNNIHPYSSSEYSSEVTISDDITLSSDYTLTVADGGVLTLTGSVSCSNASWLVVNDGGQLIVSNTGVQATFQKNITGYDTSKDDDNPDNDGYSLIAKPTTGNMTLTDGEGMLANDYDLYYFDEKENGFEWRNYKAEAFEIKNGIGYLYANSENITLNFAGVVPTETSKSNISLSYTADNDFEGFNLMGNPLSVNITSMKINTTPCGYYKLNNDGTFTSVTNVALDPVVVGQGFMVEAESTTDKLHLNPAAKDEESFSNEIIGLEVANSKYTDVAYICFGNMLPLTKINHMNDEAPMIYIHNESADNAVAVYNNRGEVKSVDVNFEAKTTGTYTISAKMMKGEVKYMHLYDRLTGIDTDLLMDDYSFIGAKSDIAGRFILNLESVDNNSSTGSDTFAYQSGNDIIVNGEGTLAVYDVTGRKVLATTINGVETINGLNSGVYIFRIIGETLRTQKIVVR